MQRHTLTGHALLTGSGNELLELAATIALTHHERVEGSNYPHGLAGDAIPLEGRIVALADVFDALTSDRVYRPKFSLEQALNIMAEGRGSQFDADLFDTFMEALPRLVAAAQEKSIAIAGAGQRPPTQRRHLIGLLLCENCGRTRGNRILTLWIVGRARGPLSARHRPATALERRAPGRCSQMWPLWVRPPRLGHYDP